MSRRPVPRTLRNAARAAKADRRTAEHDEAVSRTDAEESDAAVPDVEVRDTAAPRVSVRVRPDGRSVAKPAPRTRPSAASRPRPGPRRLAPGRPSPAGRPSLWLVGAVVLAVLAAGILGVVDLLAMRSGEGSREAQAAAVTDTQVLLSYDHRRIDADVAAARQRLTGSFADEYAKTSKALIPIAVQYKAVVRASVSAAGIVRADGDEAVILLYVNQSTTSTRIQGTKVDQNRVRVTMKKVDGDWRIAKVEAL